jgi:chitinase
MSLPPETDVQKRVSRFPQPARAVLRNLRAAIAMAATAVTLALTPTSAFAAATGAPGTPNLSPNNYNGANSVAIIMNMWWGNNGTSWQLFQNGTLVYSASLTDNSPNAQTATSATISNLPLGTYSFTAKLINSFGTTTSSALSYTVTQSGGTGPSIPATPTGLTATVNSSSQITVTWNASSGATSYDLTVDGTVHTGVTSPFVHSGLAASSAHTYSVRADNSAGSSAYSATVSATTQSGATAPATPTGLTATVNSSSQITVTWNASSGATSYDLNVDGTVHTGVTSPFVHSGLAASSAHTYSVRADNSFGSSAYSASVSATTQSAATAPATPTGLTATVNSSSQITVTWNASFGATSYDLQVDGTVHSGVTSPFVHSGLTASSAHTYSVRADNSVGDSAYSNSVSATTSGTSTYPAWAPNVVYTVGQIVSYNGTNYQCLQSHTSEVGWEPPNAPALWSVYSGGTGPTIPATPTGLTATVNSSSQITVTWNASSGATSYDLTVDGTTHTGVTSPYVHSGLAASSSHTYSVRADNSAGDSAFSASVSATTSNGTVTVPPVPIGLAATANSTSQITVSWNASSGATSYDLQVDGIVHTGVTSPFVHSGLATSSSHTYAVRADNSAGDSAYSSSVSATTQGTSTVGLPKHIMSGYWHTWSSGPGFIPLAQVDSNWDVINVAFATPTAGPGATDGHMTLDTSGFAAGYTASNFIADIQTMHSRGKKIVISVSGYSDYFSLTTSSSVSAFVADMESIINQYGFDGIDIDLEQSSVQFNPGADPDFKNPVSPKVVNVISALRQLTGHYGSNFILSWAPETFYLQLGYQFYAGLNGNVDARAGDYLPMIYALRSQTTYVQAQLYNSGSILAPDGNSYSMGDEPSLVEMCKMLLTGFNINENASYPFPALRPDQVVIGVPASSSAAGSGQVSNATLQQAFGVLNSAYPGMRGIMAWSINWDNFQNANSFVDGNKAYLNSQP